MTKCIIVVGGGIVGVCSALLLQRAGHTVRLIDAKKPGRETSYGNAGVFAEASFVVLNSPDLLKMLPKLLFNQTLKLRVNHLFLLKRLPWFLQFLSPTCSAVLKRRTLALPRRTHIPALVHGPLRFRRER